MVSIDWLLLITVFLAVKNGPDCRMQRKPCSHGLNCKSGLIKFSFLCCLKPLLWEGRWHGRAQPHQISEATESQYSERKPAGSNDKPPPLLNSIESPLMELPCVGCGLSALNTCRISLISTQGKAGEASFGSTLGLRCSVL